MYVHACPDVRTDALRALSFAVSLDLFPFFFTVVQLFGDKQCTVAQRDKKKLGKRYFKLKAERI